MKGWRSLISPLQDRPGIPQRCHSIGIDRQERCLMKEAKDINII